MAEEKKQEEVYVHPEEKASFPYETACIIVFAISAIISLIATIIYSWNSVKYDKLVANNSSNTTDMEAFLKLMSETKPIAIAFFLIGVIAFGVGMYFHFSAKKKKSGDASKETTK